MCTFHSYDVLAQIFIFFRGIMNMHIFHSCDNLAQLLLLFIDIILKDDEHVNFQL